MKKKAMLVFYKMNECNKMWERLKAITTKSKLKRAELDSENKEIPEKVNELIESYNELIAKIEGLPRYKEIEKMQREIEEEIQPMIQQKELMDELAIIIKSEIKRMQELLALDPMNEETVERIASEECWQIEFPKDDKLKRDSQWELVNLIGGEVTIKKIKKHNRWVNKNIKTTIKYLKFMLRPVEKALRKVNKG